MAKDSSGRLPDSCREAWLVMGQRRAGRFLHGGRREPEETSHRRIPFGEKGEQDYAGEQGDRPDIILASCDDMRRIYGLDVRSAFSGQLLHFNLFGGALVDVVDCLLKAEVAVKR